MGCKYEETIYDPQNDKYLTKEEFLALKERDPGYTLVVFSPPRKEWLPEWTKVPHFGVSGDGMPGLDADGNRLTWDSPYESYSGHPRTAGTHAKALRIAREEGTPLLHAIAQLSYWHAKHLGDTGLEGMQMRGRLQEGMVADITIFDPEAVTEHSDYTFGKSGLPSTGIPYVLVNGTVVVDDSKVLEGVYPGQSIRFPVEAEGRFEPVSKASLLSILTTSSPELGFDDATMGRPADDSN
jgi:hypothetical protein